MGRHEDFLDEHVPSSGEVAVDVGASQGEYSDFLAARFLSVLAIEPHPVGAIALRRLADRRPNLTVLEAAAGDRAGMEILYEMPGDVGIGLSSLRARHPLWGTDGVSWAPVRVLRLDDLSIAGRVDFLKIDTEGWEVPALAGALRLVQKDRPRILVEEHVLGDLDLVAGMLDPFGYSFLIVTRPGPGRSLAWLVATPKGGRP